MRETKLRFMRNDVPGSFRGIARNEKRIEQRVVAENHDRHCQEATPSRDFGGRALRLVDRVNCHFVFFW